jgi:hypothetical protein
MVAGIHNGAAVVGFNAHMSGAAGFTERYVFVFDVGYLAYLSAAFEKQSSHFAGGHSENGVSAFFSHQTDESACSAGDLSAFAGFHFDVVNGCACRYVAERKRVSRFDLDFVAGHYRVADLGFVRRDYISFFAVSVVDQSDIGGPVGIVFDGGDSAFYAVFSGGEIDFSIQSFVSAASEASGNAALIVAAAVAFYFFRETFFGPFVRKLRMVSNRFKTNAGRNWFKAFKSHCFLLNLYKKL